MTEMDAESIDAIDEELRNMEPSAGPGGVREGEPK